MANTTWNPSDKSASTTLSGSNLIATFTSGNQGVRATDRQVTGKFYYEVTGTTLSATVGLIGLANATATLTAMNGSVNNNAIGIAVGTGNIVMNSVNVGPTLGARANGDVIGVAVDLDNRLVWFRVAPSGNWNGTAGFGPGGTGGVNFAAVGGIGIPVYPACGVQFAPTAVYTANFGDTAFSGAVPAGFTSGFTAGATINTNAIITQAGVEEWFVPIPDAQITQVAIEQWQQPSPDVQATQVFAEHWLQANADAQVTQIFIEHWMSVQATYPTITHPTRILSGSRAGIGSVVVSS